MKKYVNFKNLDKVLGMRLYNMWTFEFPLINY